VDAVTIATAPFSHRDLTIAFLAAGKHVLVEKPMALDPTAASEMAAAAATHARVLAVVHNFQFARSVVRARRLLDGGRLGELREVWGVQLSNPQRRLPLWYDSLPLGLFFDESPHFFYLMRHFLGDALHVSSARVRPPSDADHATPRSVSVDLDGGRAPGRIEMNFMAPLSEWQLVIVGSRKLALIDIFRDILVVLANDGEHLPGQILRTSADAMRGHLWGTLTSGVRFARGSLAYGNDEVIRRFRSACTGEGPALGISAADGQAVVELQHGVVLSAASP
jgi:scyllo-inositol 2-dehydrogenase (NADP+)